MVTQFHPDWWKDKDNALPWTKRFAEECIRADPTLHLNPETNETIGIVFFNKKNGEIVPVGITALQEKTFLFKYHPSYLLREDMPAISASLPKRKKHYESKDKILSFFDNLPAEGWFGRAQGQALSQNIDVINGEKDIEPIESRYHRLMMFGRDCPGAVWATYAKIDPAIAEEHFQETVVAALRSRSSISGVQPKLLAVIDDRKLRPTNYWETSTHIIKLPPERNPELVEYEYMAILATKHLLPRDEIVDADLTDLHLRDGSKRKVLAIKRFDRTEGQGKIHFEEVNQLLGNQNHDRYNGSYSDIAHVLDEKIGHDSVKQFYARLVTQFLVGNVDNHFKNFALFSNGSWKMTPDYDLAPSASFVTHGTLALKMPGAEYKDRDGKTRFARADKDVEYKTLNAKGIVNLGREFGLSIDEIKQITTEIRSHIPDAIAAVLDDPHKDLDSTLKGHKGQNRTTTYRQDFCDRLKGHCTSMFSTFDRYLSIVASKEKSFIEGPG